MALALPTPDEQGTLAERVRRGEPGAEHDLVRLFEPRIAMLVRARTGDRERARDLTQEVMLAVVLALRKGQLRDTERLTSFVYGTARNVINNHLRSSRRAPREAPLEDVHAGISPPDPLEDSERSALVEQALEALDDLDRRILRLTLNDGLKSGEIAARLGLTSEVVRARKSRALKKTIENVLHR
jgi:RNA polymerase sigma-70 factor (ECF subfamily)